MAKSDQDIYNGNAQKLSELSVGHLGVEHDVVLSPLQHDSPGEIAQTEGVADWGRNECEPMYLTALMRQNQKLRCIV
ncbi:Respiratory nitrate reductase alpha chain [Caballeronia sordidicola]|jgi:nitrate reductase alpha subunit|uniref:Respiratory nitrate reductase alpha chain n=1 Tax=Caballeronia sordidicola TaxID=196367 RepID=A0A242MGE5_CABSO|nr:Respiratory nitrate reductase alpha chain [Caballeronia sordidicola]